MDNDTKPAEENGQDQDSKQNQNCKQNDNEAETETPKSKKAKESDEKPESQKSTNGNVEEKKTVENKEEVEEKKVEHPKQESDEKENDKENEKLVPDMKEEKQSEKKEEVPNENKEKSDEDHGDEQSGDKKSENLKDVPKKRGRKARKILNSSFDNDLKNTSVTKAKTASTPVKIENTPTSPKPVSYTHTQGPKEQIKSASKPSFNFDTLVRHLKLIKLPSATWKVRIVVSSKQQISEVTFSNKKPYERCVNFKRTVPGHTVLFNGSPVSFLGAPENFDNFEDVAVLLSIVDAISVEDPILNFEKGK